MTPESLADLSARAYTHMQPWSAQAFADTLARPHALLTVTEHAFVLGLVVAGEAEVLALAADPDHLRKGHAARTLACFHQDAEKRGASRVFLEVASQNAPARALYAAAGYTPAGLRKGYYPQPGAPADDALVLTRILP
ncbi:GNAT family N-acetyltransferase [Sagittula salina]|uniref:GNAT family N-acetyltransferase n=1 Tax=Sagittula salina TaxID=2820268 RepID=A0A940MN77_9RHOB|nr:GNAT family N-acetyltransferase [Sagittula salina]MBP0481613.1 GNAT family N-acetyltransferase [Sagittula salina]